MKSRAFVHLGRRAVGSVSNREPDGAETERARAILGDAEFALWSSMQGRDRRHSLQVLSRFDALAPGAERWARAAALLHDVGKTESDLGWMGRIVATVVGPRGARLRSYHDHEILGAALLGGVSDPRTVALAVSNDPADPLAAALRQADDI
ncbi:MAG: HD domain-containing protein [Actinomycetota bacterium]